MDTPGGDAYYDYTPGMDANDDYDELDLNLDHMSPEEIEDLLKPLSTKIRRIIYYDHKTKRYQLN